ncbi:MAG: heme-copper oxidase subunit III [Candidatus Hermodarchaeota archaeon]
MAQKIHLLHPILIHFHIALFAFALFAMLISLFLALLSKSSYFEQQILKKLLKGRVNLTIINHYVNQFEFMSFFAMVAGFIMLLITAFAGFTDASGLGIEGLSINSFFLGLKAASESQTISYKVIYSIFGASCFALVIAMRLYFTNYRKERVCDQPLLVSALYAGGQVLGYFLLSMVASGGALIVYGEATYELIPILRDFLPGGQGDLLIIIIAAAFFGLFIILVSQIGRAPREEAPPEEEISLWPPALALGTGALGLGALLIAQGDLLSAIGLIILFLVLILAYAFKEITEVQIEKTSHSWIWVFLASEVMFFGILIGVSFALRLTSIPAFYPLCGDNASPPWPNAAEILNIPLTAINTFVLILSSFTMVKAVESITQYGNVKRLRNYLALTGILGSIFLGIQIFEYNNLFHEGFTPAFGLLGATFYLQTGFHGLHVFIGVLLVFFITLKAARGGYSKENFSGVEQVGLFWHFVDLVWIVLFTLIYLI